MGFKNNKKTTFIPLELTEKNVQTVFNRCLATDSTRESITCNLYFNKRF